MIEADVCMVLEGTYPYVTGGVSAWVHNILKSLKQVKFSLLVIVPKSGTYTETKYDIPSNVIGMTEVCIHDYNLSTKRKWGSKKKAFKLIEDFYEDMENYDYSLLNDVYRDVLNPKTRKVSTKDLFESRYTWDILLNAYKKFAPEDSFIDFFWAYRYSHLPILKILDSELPKAKVYHAISTGYASLAAILANYQGDSKFILTEHGIYTNERRIEVEQSDWIFEQKDNEIVVKDKVSAIKGFWVSFFDHIGRIAYNKADNIITLSDKNQNMQIMNGANIEKCRIIPNGINLSFYTSKKQERKEGEPIRIGFVGRVVPIKDVRTFINACKLIHDQLPDAKVFIMGPTDEDEDYFNECEDLVAILNLKDMITFTGRVNLKEEYPKLDVVVLTSISEGQPLVIMEANCCGVPCVATDVGACAELLNGRSSEDIALGPSGLVTPIFDPQATATAILEIVNDTALQAKMGKSGMERIKKFYNEEDLNFAYLDLYQQHILELERKKNEWQA